ncbi:MAG TPA: hypothetical protein DDZ51_16220 [Planctomycetaceae bacterium]|nr:hypothetical protein [Planctomycetaceae bacterium]
MCRKKVLLKRLAAIVALTMSLLIVVLIVNYRRFESRQMNVKPIQMLTLDRDLILKRLQGAIQIPTLSSPMSRIVDDSDLYRFRDYIESSFPEVHALPCVRRTGKDFGDERIPSMLFEWPGQQPELGAILLMSHFDVVPVEVDSRSQWTHPPFSGHVDDEFIWGRGTLDCKHGVMAILEAVNMLVANGFKPQRSIYIALGHDEEIGGADGNKKIAEWFRSNGIRLHTIVDEGGCVFAEFPGLESPAALIGVAEKGFLTVDVTASVDADKVGHSSMPPRETAVSILSTAIHHVQESPFPSRIDAGLKDTLMFLGPEMPFVTKLAVSNLWLLGPLVERQLSAKPSGDALLRTTIAPTLIQGGVLANVLPMQATAKLNLRLLPGDTVESAVNHLRDSIADPRVSLSPLDVPREASPVSPIDTDPFRILQTTIHQVFPDVVVAPFVLVGGTDTVHYTDLCEHIYRFIPARLSERDTKRFHGINERIAIENYFELLRFFHQFVVNASQK